MTVREVMGVLGYAQELCIGYGGGCTTVNPKDRIITEAFGDYVVDRVLALGENSFEIDIAVRPIKAMHTEPEGN